MTERLRKILRKIVIEEISCVRKPANEHAKVLIMKSADTLPETGLDAVEMIKKMQANGDFEGFEKADYLDLLNGLAEEIQQDGESIQKTFVRGLETPAGVELFALLKAQELAHKTGLSYAQAYTRIIDDPKYRRIGRAWRRGQREDWTDCYKRRSCTALHANPC